MPTNTHMGQPASQLVLLESIGIADTGDPQQDLGFFRTLPTGAHTPTSGKGFCPPRGKVLIITDVDWQYAGGAPGGMQVFRIFVAGQRVCESAITLSASGEGGISEALTTGFVVAPGKLLSVDTSPGGGRIQHVLLRGYLAPNA
jgi:hypothetical protein